MQENLTKLIFAVSMGVTFLLALTLPISFLPEPPENMRGAVNGLCIAAIVFAVGILAYGYGQSREIARLRALIDEKLRQCPQSTLAQIDRPQVTFKTEGYNKRYYGDR